MGHYYRAIDVLPAATTQQTYYYMGLDRTYHSHRFILSFTF